MKYKLLKDLPGIKAGEILDDTKYYTQLPAYIHQTPFIAYPEWFKEISPEEKPELANSCKTCFYFLAKKNEHGDCKKNAPKIELLAGTAVWPEVHQNDYCGQYELPF